MFEKMSNQKKLFKGLKIQSKTQGEQGVEEDRKKQTVQKHGQIHKSGPIK